MNHPGNAASSFVPSPQFRLAMQKFDEANAQDPNTERVDGRPLPRELLYSERLTDWVLRLCPEASETLRLAARSQHLCRWIIPRHQYELNKAGYLRWRSDLKKFHAAKAAEILNQCGYPQEVIARVQTLNLKKDFPQDPESQTLEDALCLVFLEFQFADLARRTDESKMINALQKSWKKMSPRARELAGTLPYSEPELALLKKALGKGVEAAPGAGDKQTIN